MPQLLGETDAEYQIGNEDGTSFSIPKAALFGYGGPPPAPPMPGSPGPAAIPPTPDALLPGASAPPPPPAEPEPYRMPVAAGEGGLVQPGNIDVYNRPKVRNPDGSVSTVRSMSFNDRGREVLVPTVSDDGRILSDAEAVQAYRKTGKHLGMFDSPESADAYAQALHDNYERGVYDTPEEKYQKGAASNYDQRIEAAKQQSDAQAQQADVSAAGQRKAAEQYQADVETEQRARAEAQAKAQADFAQLRAEADALAQEKTDPNHWFESRTGAQKIAAVLGMALGGISQVRSGGQNPALAIINRFIDDDLASQRFNIEQRNRAHSAKVGLAERDYARGQDVLKEMALGRAMRYDAAIKATAAEAAKYDSPVLKAKAMDIAGQLQQERDAGLAQYAAASEQRHYERAQDAAKQKLQQQQLGLGYAQLKQSDEHFKQELGLKAQQATQAGDLERAKLLQKQAGLAIFGVSTPDRPVFAPSEKVAEEINAKASTAAQMVSGLDKLSAIYARSGWESAKLGDKDAYEAQTILGDLQTSYAKLKNQGAISKDDRASYDRIFGGDPTGIRDFRTKWRSMRDRIESDVTNDIKQRTGNDTKFHIESPEESHARLGFEPGATPTSQMKAVPLPDGSYSGVFTRPDRGGWVDGQGRLLTFHPTPSGEELIDPDGKVVLTADRAKQLRVGK